MVGECLQIAWWYVEAGQNDYLTMNIFPVSPVTVWVLGMKEKSGGDISSGGSSEPLDTNNNVLFWIDTRIPTSLNHTSLPIFEDKARINIDLSLYDLNPPPRST